MTSEDPKGRPATAGAEDSVLTRMARAGKETRAARMVTMVKALRITCAKVAVDLMDMAMAVIAIRAEDRESDTLSDLFDPSQLLILLDGPLARRGAVVMDRALVGGLIQQQTMASVTPAPEEDTRSLTETDAAVCAPFIDALFAWATPKVEDPTERALMEGYTFGARMEDPRLLLMALEAPSYHVVHLTVDIASGARQGQMVLCLPHNVSDDLPIEPSEEQAEAAGHAIGEPPFGKTVLGLNMTLDVVLTRLKLSLHAMQGLRIGDVLELQTTAFDQCRVQTPGGQVLSRGTLGQISGVRALQLEHASMALREPRRRKADRDTLELPQVTGDGTGTLRDAEPKKLPPLNSVFPADLPAVIEPNDEAMSAPENLADLPDMSDLPGFEEVEEVMQEVGLS